MSVRAFSIAAVLIGMAGWGHAQNLARPGGGSRPFAEPLYWLNIGTADRLPITERSLSDTEGSVALIPPAPRRTGLTPRLGFTVEATDRSVDGKASTYAVVSPGLAYRKFTRRMQLDADIAVDAIKDFTDDSRSALIGGVGARARLAYSLSPRTQARGTVRYSRVPGAGDGLGTALLPADINVDTFELGAAIDHGIDRRRRVSGGVSYTNLSSDLPLGRDVGLLAFDGAYSVRIDRFSELRSEARVLGFDYEGAGQALAWSALARYTRDLGDRFAVSGAIGALGTDADGGNLFPAFDMQLTYTEKFARYDVTAGRRWATNSLNVVAPILSDRIEGRALYRIAPGLQLRAVAGLEWLEPIVPSPGRTRTRIASVEGEMSYALDRNTWLWGRIEYSDERTGPIEGRSTTLRIGVSRTFEP